MPDYAGVGSKSGLVYWLTDYVFGGLQRYLEEIEGASLESGGDGDEPFSGLGKATRHRFTGLPPLLIGAP